MTNETATDIYQPARPVMTAAELDAHEVSSYGRDYRESDDGYGDMEAGARRGWQPVSAWGADGWDLGSWPYVVISVRNAVGAQADDDGRPHIRFEMRQTVEGDSTAYAFDSIGERDAAIDYLFHWYAADNEWSVCTWETRGELDAGRLDVPTRYRGPYRGYFVS